MLKNSFILLFSISLIAVMAYGATGTGAWFTDQDTIAQNTITTGNLDLALENISKTSPQLEPGGGYQETIRFCAKNNGNYAMKFRGNLVSIPVDSPLLTNILVKVIANPPGLQGNFGPVATTLVENVAISSFTSGNSLIVLDSTTVGSGFPLFTNGSKICYSVLVKLSAQAKNDLKARSFQASLIVDATQWINPSWGE